MLAPVLSPVLAPKFPKQPLVLLLLSNAVLISADGSVLRVA
jgi:hypothetical protein